MFIAIQDYLLLLLAFSIPIVGMLAGLVSSVTIPIFLLIWLYQHKNNIITILPSLKYRAEFFFLGWAALTCLWSKNSAGSTHTVIAISAVVFATIIAIKLTYSIDYKKRDRIMLLLFLGVVTAIKLFFTEKFSNGMILKTFWSIFQPEHTARSFALHMLDRGCALLSVISWVVIGQLMSKKQYLKTLILYAAIFILLGSSDSLASFVGFLCGGFMLLLGLHFGIKFYRLLRVVMIIGILATPVLALYIAPEKFVTYNIIPDSAKHRLFIWHFVANKALSHPIIGYGFGAAKYIQDNQENEMIIYKGQHWSPLPLHPHNNILQIWLETGIVGLILFIFILNYWLSLIESNKNHLFVSISYSCFINYFLIGMISYNAWQSWWLCTAGWAAFMLVYSFKFRKNKI